MSADLRFSPTAGSSYSGRRQRSIDPARTAALRRLRNLESCYASSWPNSAEFNELNIRCGFRYRTCTRSAAAESSPQ